MANHFVLGVNDESESECDRSFHGRIPPGLEAAGGLNGGKGGDGRRVEAKEYGGVEGQAGHKSGQKSKKEARVDKKSWSENADKMPDGIDVFVGRHAKTMKRFIEATFV